jgi:hypothetical protein
MHWLGLERHGDWRVKRYGILHGGRPLDRGRFAEGVALALAALPEVAVSAVRPGVALLISHQGRTGDYVVLGWWDNENELPLRVFVRDGATERWRPAEGSESVCVWDLEILWLERNAYVQTVLGASPSVDTYAAAQVVPASGSPK